MARPKKNNADYFSHDAHMRDGKRVKAVRLKYGLAGYAVYCMLLETLAHADFFEISIEGIKLDLLAGDFGAVPTRLKEIIDYCVLIGLLQMRDDVIFSQELKDRLKGVLDKRNSRIQSFPSQKISETDISGVDNTQKKRKEIKLKEKKEIHTVERMTEKDFEDFWTKYPNKQGKENARKKFLALERILLPEILLKLELFKKTDQWVKDSGRFIPQGDTWVNQKRWNDELTRQSFSPPKPGSLEYHLGDRQFNQNLP